MRFGIELEVVGMNAQDMAALISSKGIPCDAPGYTHRVMGNWKVVPDGSVSNGCEIVSPPMTVGEEAFVMIRKICRIVNDAGCSVNKSCGFHCHIEIATLSSQHVANIFNRYRKFQDKINEFLAPVRRNNHYCERASHDLRPADTVQGLVAQQQSRRAAVNLQSFVKYGTIEFRQHQGTTNPSEIINWVKFLAAFIAASEHPAETVIETPVVQVAPPEVLTAASSGVPRESYIAMPASSRRIIDLLTGSARVTAEELAQQLGMTPDSVRSSISRLRTRYNVRINFRRGAYGLLTATRPYVPAPVAPQPRVVSQDRLWAGISGDLELYYDRRRSCIASGA